MNPALVDPDIKVHMSLDEIIQLSKGQINTQTPGRRARKKKRHQKKAAGVDHSVPLLSSAEGVGIYVSRKSSLLRAEHQKWIKRAVSNRAINCDLLQKSKVIVPAEYKLFRTDQGVERILVPTPEYFSKSSRKKLLPPRKLNKATNELPSDAPPPLIPSYAPPPLITAPIYNPTSCKPEPKDMKMEVDGPEDDILILDTPSSKKLLEVIDVECNLPVDVLEAKKLCVTDIGFRHNGVAKTLSDRFTMLTGSFQF